MVACSPWCGAWPKGQLAIFIVLLTPLLANSEAEPNEQKVDKAEMAEFVNTIGRPAGVTHSQIQQWYEEKAGSLKFAEYPRLFPFCTTSKQAKLLSPGRHLHEFAKILSMLEETAEPFFTFDPNTESTFFNTTWIKNVSISRINTPQKDMVNLKQWLHVKIEANESNPLQGLYVQSIVGPLGLPYGEFNVQFPCKDDLENTTDIAEIGQIAHCAYRPRAGVDHPAVYVGLAPKGTTRSVFHMHFKWSDITCLETPYVQFIMIAVRNFRDGVPELDVDYKPLFSPVFVNLGFDSKSGAPFPYHPMWENDMYCFLNQTTHATTFSNPKPDPEKVREQVFDALKWEDGSAKVKVYRVQPNEDYDSCIRSSLDGKEDLKRDDVRNLCAPGPFLCDKSLKDSVDNIDTLREQLLTTEIKVSKCYPCGMPKCGADIGFSKTDCGHDITVTVNSSGFLDKILSSSGARVHGYIAMLGMLVLLPVANFMGRFYKEVYNNCLCGNGPWIFIHVACHVGAIALVWLSVGPVIPVITDYATVLEQCLILAEEDHERAVRCAYVQSASNPHISIGAIAFILQHILALTGCCRSTSKGILGIQLIIHSHLGHLTFFIGAVAAIIGASYNPCIDGVIFNMMLLILPLMFFVVGVIIDIVMDKKLGLKPGRKQWPVLEPIKIEGKSPCTFVKLLVFVFFAGLLGLFWFLTFVSYTLANESGENSLEEQQSLNATILNLLRPNSLFGVCNTYI